MARKTEKQVLQTRKKLINAARKIFLAEGFSHSSLEKIAKSAGVTRGAIYSQFPGGKKQLLEAVFLDLDHKINLSREKKAQKEPDTLPLELYISWWLESLENKGWLRQYIELSFQEICMKEANCQHLGRKPQMIDEFKVILNEIISESYEKQEVKPQLPLSILSTQIMGMLLGLTIALYHQAWPYEQIQEGKASLYAWLEMIKLHGENK